MSLRLIPLNFDHHGLYNNKQAIIADYYTFHYEELLAFVASRLHIYSDEAEDIVQNVFLRLLQTDRMITPITLPCLVYTMARHLICDFGGTGSG